MTDSAGSRQSWRRPWIKLWVEMLDDPKYLDLGPAQQAAWVNLLLATTRSPEPGKMLRPNGRPMSAEQVRTAVRAHAMSPAEFQATLEDLESMGMIHWEDDALTITHWHRRQDPETPAQRMRRYRERLREGNGHPPEHVTSPVTERNRQGNSPGTPDPPPVTSSVTERNAAPAQEVTQGVTEGNGPPSPSASNQLSSRPEQDVTGGVTQRHTRGVEGGGALAPPQKTRREEDTPSGAEAPSGAAPTFSPDSASEAQLQGLTGSEKVPAAPAAPEPDHSSPSQGKDGGGTAPRPEANGEDSRPESAGGGRAAPRAMSGRRKTGGNPQVDGVLEAIEALWGQPIVHWAKEAKEVKAALARGYEPEQVVACFQAAQESARWRGRWMPLAYLVEDLGEFVKNGGSPLRKWGQPPGKEESRAQSRPPLPTAEDWRSRQGRW